MVTTIVYVHVKKEYVEDFIEATKKNHQASIMEYGNMRFDFLQDESNPCKFVLYEAYESKEKAAAHKETEHYTAWRSSVENYMAEKRNGVPYKGIKP
ncbi:MAG TPA: antibiotic biosynthesis monooxygenase [Victivallales bacterium]|nr:antibiotic biosynthesis monooxygenase [Victivallales bacterium]